MNVCIQFPDGTSVTDIDFKYSAGHTFRVGEHFFIEGKPEVYFIDRIEHQMRAGDDGLLTAVVMHVILIEDKSHEV